MNKLLTCTALLLALAAPALASGDNINQNDGIANTGTIQNSVLNNNSGPGAGAIITPTAKSDAKAAAASEAKAIAKQRQEQKQQQSQKAVSEVKGSGNATLSSDDDVIIPAPKVPASTAYAAPLVAAEDTCMGSTSAGGQGVGFGLSIGSTWSDADCVRRKDSRELHNMGFRKGAIALMCQSANVRKAMAAAGTPCVGSEDDYAPAAGEVIDDNEHLPVASGSPAKH